MLLKPVDNQDQGQAGRSTKRSLWLLRCTTTTATPRHKRRILHHFSEGLFWRGLAEASSLLSGSATLQEMTSVCELNKKRDVDSSTNLLPNSKLDKTSIYFQSSLVSLLFLSVSPRPLQNIIDRKTFLCWDFYMSFCSFKSRRSWPGS